MIHQLLVLGEATKRVSDTYRALQPHIAWRKIAGMRDILVHSYDAVDIDEVWSVATRDVPALITLLEPLVA